MQEPRNQKRRSVTLANSVGGRPHTKKPGIHLGSDDPVHLSSPNTTTAAPPPEPVPAPVPASAMSTAYQPSSALQTLDLSSSGNATLDKAYPPVSPTGFTLDPKTLNRVRQIIQDYSEDTGLLVGEPLTDELVTYISEHMLRNFLTKDGSVDDCMAAFFYKTGVFSTGQSGDSGAVKGAQRRKGGKKAPKLVRRRGDGNIITPAGGGEVMIKEDYANGWVEMISRYERAGHPLCRWQK